MALKGCEASFLVGANEVASLSNISNSITGDSLDVTTFDSSCTREFIQGLKSGQMSISGYYDPTDSTGQAALITAVLNGDNVDNPKFLVDATHGFTAESSVVTGVTIDGEVSGLINFSATLQLSGAISVV